MTNLMYIVGSGRSGSTVIERVLNAAPNVISVGEVHALWRLPVADLLCSCGSRVPDCAFWQEALEDAGIGRPALQRLAQLEREVVRNRYLMQLRFDLNRIRTDDRLSEFAALQAALMQGVRKAGRADIVLDSSKAGPRAWALAAHLDPLFLHVYRGAEDVIASWRRPKFEPSTGAPMKKPGLAEAALDWVKAEQAARGLAGVANVSRINYSAFASAPRPTLETALDELLPGLVATVNWVSPRSVHPARQYHSVLGNPDRFDKADILIAPQKASDRARFGSFERGVIGAIGKTLERAYP